MSEIIAWCLNKLRGMFFRRPLMDRRILIGIFIFLWFFYATVADRIFPTTVLGSRPNILNPLAYWDAFGDQNMLALFFPFVPLSLVPLLHHYWRQKPFWAILGWIIIFDYIVAILSSKEVHDYQLLNVEEYDEESWSLLFGWPDYFFDVLIVMLCGFGASFAAGLLYHALEGKVGPSTDIDAEESADIGIEE